MDKGYDEAYILKYEIPIIQGKFVFSLKYVKRCA